MSSATRPPRESAAEVAAGFDVFLSYTRDDREAVEAVARRLRLARIELFFDQWSSTAGRSWQLEVLEALTASKSCAVFVGPSGLGDWERQELGVATDRATKDPRFRLFMVLLDGAWVDDPALAFLRTRSWVDLRGDAASDREGFAELVAAVIGRPRPRAPKLAAATACPYRGLQPFDASDADLFFGREDDTRRLVDLLREPRSHFLAVLGPSGSGKSSLVRAGLIAAIRAGAVGAADDWTVETITPGARPADTLAALLIRMASEESMQGTVDRLLSDARTLDHAVSLALAGERRGRRCLLLVDQFEEVFALCEDEDQRSAFIENIAYAATIAGGSTVVVCAIRADFYDRCAAYPLLRAVIMSRQFLLGPLDEAGLRRAIEEPAWRAGARLQPALVRALIDDVGDRRGALPLLQHALLELWERRIDDELTLEAYIESGGVEEALARRADSVYLELSPPLRETARRVLLALVQPGTETEDTRRREEIGHLTRSPDRRTDVDAVVEVLADARLVTTSRDPATAARMAEITHEALIRGWPRLRRWIDGDREMLLARSHLSAAALEWERADRPDDELYPSARLAAWPEGHDYGLSELEREYLAASRAWQARRQRAARRRVKLGFAALSLVLAVVTAAAVMTLRATERAEEQRDAARSRELAIAANAELAGQPARALDLALSAYGIAPTKEAETVLRQATLESRAVAGARAHAAAVWAVNVSPDGQWIASGAADGTVVLWRWRSGERVHLRAGGPIYTVVFSPDGGRVAAAGDDRAIRVWPVGHAAAPVVVGRSPAEVRDVAWKPDGNSLASVDRSGAVRLWSVRPGGRKLALAPAGKRLQAVAFTPDGKHLVAVGKNTGVLTWRLGSRRPPRRLGSATDHLVALALAPRDETLAVAGASGRVRLWNLARGRQMRTLDAHTEVYGLAFTRDGRHLAATGEDGAVRVFDRAGRLVSTMKGLGRPTESLAPGAAPGSLVSGDRDGVVWVWQPSPDTVFSPIRQAMSVATTPGGDRIAAVDYAGRVWESEPGAPRRPQLVAATGRPLFSVAFDRAGRGVVAAGASGRVLLRTAKARKASALSIPSDAQIWDALATPDGKAVLSVDQGGRGWVTATDGSGSEVAVKHDGAAVDVSLSPDGKTMLTTGRDEIVRATRLQAPRRSRVLLRVQASGADFSPSGQGLLTAGEDGALRLWTTGGAAQRVLLGHAGRIWHAAFTPDGQRIVSAGADGTVRVWDASTGGGTILRDFNQPVIRIAASRGAQQVAMVLIDGSVHLASCDVCGSTESVVAVARRRWTP